jgi:hypothetical protein
LGAADLLAEPLYDIAYVHFDGVGGFGHHVISVGLAGQAGSGRK